MAAGTPEAEAWELWGDPATREVAPGPWRVAETRFPRPHPRDGHSTIAFQFPTLDCISRQRKMRVEKIKKRNQKNQNREKRVEIKVGVMIKAGERNEIKRLELFSPPPPKKGPGRETGVMRPGPVPTARPLHIHGRTRPAGRRHTAEKVIPQSEWQQKHLLNGIHL